MILLAAAAAVVACSSSQPSAPQADAGPVYDNDTARLAHCNFESSPPQSTKPAPSPASIRAGLGSAVLSLPIGTPFGGYTERSQSLGSDSPIDARAFRWAKDFAPSVGVYDAPRVEALALEVGGERWVLVRMDAILILAPAIYAVEDAVAPDGSLRGRITISASHSHSAWAAWQPTYWLLPGVDRPRKDLFDRVVAAIASAVNQALASLAPARLGLAQMDNFDPSDTVSHDRRPENNHILGPDGNRAGANKDPYVWAMRVDHTDGTPMAALIDLADHGTVGDDPNELATTDAPGAIARALTSQLGYPVLHLQGVTGDIAPSGPNGRPNCPDNPHCLDMPRLEALGARAAALVGPLIQGIQTDSAAVMEVVARPSYVGHAGIVQRPGGKTLYYTPATEDYIPDGILLDEAGWAASPIDEFDAPAGAGLCGNPTMGTIAGIPATRGMGVYNSCLSMSRGGDIVFGLYSMPNIELPLCDSVRMTTTAVRFGGLSSGDWLVLAAPGEPTAPLSSYLRGKSPAGREHTLIMGYSDYGGYLLSAEDWLAGGYETTVNIWGPLQGEQVVAGLLDAAAIAWTPQIEDPQAGATRSVNWKWPGDSPITVTTTTDHGTLAMPQGQFWPDTTDPTTPVQPPATVARGVGVARFSWYGGDPAVDFPEVVLEVSQGGAFAAVTDARGTASSSYNGGMVVTYVPDPLTSPTPAHHIYSASWQAVPPDPFSESALALPFSLPLGTYRLHAHGSAQGSSGVVAYDVASAPFQVVATPLAQASTATRASSTITVSALAGPAPGLRALRDGASDGNVPLPGPWAVTLTLDDKTTQTASAMPDDNGNAVVNVTGAGAAHVVSVDVRDPAGNGGTLTPM